MQYLAGLATPKLEFWTWRISFEYSLEVTKTMKAEVSFRERKYVKKLGSLTSLTYR